MTIVEEWKVCVVSTLSLAIHFIGRLVGFAENLMRASRLTAALFARIALSHVLVLSHKLLRSIY